MDLLDAGHGRLVSAARPLPAAGIVFREIAAIYKVMRFEGLAALIIADILNTLDLFSTLLKLDVINKEKPLAIYLKMICPCISGQVPYYRTYILFLSTRHN